MNKLEQVREFHQKMGLNAPTKNELLDETEFIDNKTHKHVYRVKATDEWLQGVSSVSSIVPKDWLSAWGGKRGR